VDWLRNLGTGILDFGTNIGSNVVDYFTTDDGGVDYSALIPALTAFAASRAGNSETLSNIFGLGAEENNITGYQGGIPKYTAERQAVPMTGDAFDPDRRPGSGGRRYFSDTVFVPEGESVPAQQAIGDAQKWRLATQNLNNPFSGAGFAAGGSTSKMTGRPNPFDASMGLFPNPQPEGLPEEVTAQVAELVRSYGTPDKGNTFGVPRFQDNAEMMTYEYPYGVNAGFGESLDIVDKIVKLENTMAAGSDQQKEQAVRQIEELKSFGAAVNGIPQNSFEKFVEVQKLRNSQTPVKKAAGGLASLPHNGYYLGGPTDGMADDVPAMIGNAQPAALSDGEFVIPADVVSHLGNGNSDAGAQNLYSMMDRVRKDRTGNPKQGKEINPNSYLA